RVLLLILLCSGLNSCPAEGDIEYLAVVESNTGWELIAGDQRMEGFGDQFVYLPQNIPPVCVTVRKLSIPGYLRVQVKTEG
ncbi:MAG: hypothetical protein GWN16_06620, partial [Calditrichae bacterium]|nr:hypothetical protein [Calditrichia bacterium]NIW79144.1 hypothetical protein [Calditrichia bacterium]